ncbi:Biotin-requiring enzyme [Thalassovita litoralis]|jgi:biotin carboxyl carrier protein|uniref:Biotin carboxyl carrier protein of acetyl-CoA carboxylase n=1 Tax=Thalassovita litoralis TaxID=1010611 RepID=A0A521FHY1_9RHOB|nr:acetyl-CoA carboxylase [Thalassovita litoralis]SMO95726.1 Biotin-requiring enzyme [Thalassovita litoralis]
MTDILSPLPGTFYQRPAPEEPPYQTKGAKVAVGDTIGLVEVMKTFIPVTAETEGVFEGYEAEDASPVTAGAVLAKLG